MFPLKYLLQESMDFRYEIIVFRQGRCRYDLIIRQRLDEPTDIRM